MPADDQDGVGDGDGGLLLPDPPGQPPELGREVGVAGTGRGPGALGEDVEQPDVAVGGLARAAFAAGDVVARADPGPGSKAGGGREAGHVRADLGQDALGGPLTDPGDRGEPVTGPGERDTGLAGVRGDERVDALVELLDGALQVADVLQGESDQQRVVLAEAAAQRLPQGRDLVPQLSLASSARTTGSRSPATSAASIARPETPSTSEATESSLMPASSSVLAIRWPSAVCAWISRLR